MPNIKLPDGSVRQFDNAVAVAAVAAAIGPGRRATCDHAAIGTNRGAAIHCVTARAGRRCASGDSATRPFDGATIDAVVATRHRVHAAVRRHPEEAIHF